MNPPQTLKQKGKVRVLFLMLGWGILLVSYKLFITVMEQTDVLLIYESEMRNGFDTTLKIWAYQKIKYNEFKV